jgi:hypothetical protein
MGWGYGERVRVGQVLFVVYIDALKRVLEHFGRINYHRLAHKLGNVSLRQCQDVIVLATVVVICESERFDSAA